MSSAADELGEFFDYIWRETDGLVYVPTLMQREGADAVIKQDMYKWPQQRDVVIQHVLKAAAEGVDAYASPVLYNQGPPIKENVKGSHVLWVELDGNAPANDEAYAAKKLPAPTLKIQTSVEKNQHAYWLLDTFETDTKKIEELNRTITYTMEADKSGWNVNHFLRPPMTMNNGIKRGEKVRPAMQVLRVTEYGAAQTIETFKALPPAKQLVDMSIEMAGNLRSIDEVIAFNEWPTDLWELFTASKDSLADRSGALMRLAYTTAEKGFTDQDIFVVLENADKRWEKYAGRTDRNRQLLDIINRARLKVGYNFNDTSAIESMLGLGADSKPTTTKIVYNFMELLEADIHIDWLFENFIPIGGLGLIGSMPGIGKTQLSEQLAINVATGQDFLHWKNVNADPRKVLFLSLEMPAASLKYINEKIVQGHDPKFYDLLRENLYLATLGVPIHFDTPQGQTFIDSLMSQYQPELLVIDSVSQAVSKDLTESKTMLDFTQYTKRAIQDKYGCAVMMIHHNRKNNGIVQVPSLDDLFGNTFLGAALDVGLVLRGGIQGNVEVHQVKSRLGPKFDAFDINRTENLTFVPKENNVAVFNNVGRTEPTDSGTSFFTNGGSGFSLDT